MTPSRSHTSNCSGVALITVLAILTILVILVVGLAALATGERKSANLSSTIATNESLVDLTTNLALASLREATEPSTGATWASQPGMIRIIDGNNDLRAAHKLYSSSRRIVDNRAELNEDLAIEANPVDWQTRPAIWCDVNRPFFEEDRETGVERQVFPIVDPAALGNVKGFEFDGSTNPVPEIPMPVQWLYVLANGEIVAPNPTDGNGRLVTVPGAADSEIIGRIAYWADDETSKININTAGYARNDATYSTFWDTPVIRTNFEDLKLSLNQPWTNEFARYPGHPATTGLNVVFDTLALSEQQILALTPYFRDGGTRGGSLTSPQTPTQSQVDALLKESPLFSSVDELLLQPSRALNAAGLTPQDIQERRFFLTAQSRAPETNLFDMPKVTIWPLWTNRNLWTATDALLAFCSSIGPQGAQQTFYFTRTNPVSTKELLDIPQNLKLWNYLQALTNKPFPGFGNATFTTKYGANAFSNSWRDQILTSIFDVVRLANLDDRTREGESDGGATSFTDGTGFVAPSEGPNNTRGAGRAATLSEVMLLFARPSNDTTDISPAQDLDGDGVNDRVIDRVKAAIFFKLETPAVGMAIPGQNLRLEVRGLSGFSVRSSPTAPWQSMEFKPSPLEAAQDSFTGIQVDRGNTSQWRRAFGQGAVWSINHQKSNASGRLDVFLPLTADVILPFTSANDTFQIDGATLQIELYCPANAPSPFQRFSVRFPSGTIATDTDGNEVTNYYDFLTPLAVTNAPARWQTGQRFTDVGRTFTLFWGGDTMLSVQNTTGNPAWNILRRDLVDDFEPHRRYTNMTRFPGDTNGHSSRLASSTSPRSFTPQGFTLDTRPEIRGQLIEGWNGYSRFFSDNPGYGVSGRSPELPAPPGAKQSIQRRFAPGDFQNGYGELPEGGYWPKSDEGPALQANNNVGKQIDASPPQAVRDTHYFESFNSANNRAVGTLSTPNRQVPSPVIFGGIPVVSPWRTLLFRPDNAYPPFRAAGNPSHPGAAAPPDFLWLDLFHMPVVEPYAISEPFSTAGKINLNSRIMPFGDRIRRETALHAVLRSLRLTAIPEVAVSSGGLANDRIDQPTRFPLNVEETLAGFRGRFNESTGSAVYRAPAEVVSLNFVPEGVTQAGLQSFWSDKRVTGDNSLEAPYNALLPRLTTRSNTFTFHYTVQRLKPVPGTPPGQWDEDRGVVLGEQRGAFTVERFIDPADPEFNINTHPQFDFAARAGDANPPTLARFYKLRVISNRQFRP